MAQKANDSHGEPLYEAVWPLSKVAFEPLPVKERISDLSNKTVAFVWDYMFKGQEMWTVLKDALARRYNGVSFVDYQTFGNIHGLEERALVDAIPDKLREHGVDAVIAAVGA